MKNQTLTTVAKEAVANGGGHLEVNRAQLAFLKAKRNTKANQMNIFAWTRSVAYYESLEQN